MAADMDATPGGSPAYCAVPAVPYAASRGLQRAALVSVSATALIIAGVAAWFIVGVFAPVIGLFFGGWLLACALEPCAKGVMRLTDARLR